MSQSHGRPRATHWPHQAQDVSQAPAAVHGGRDKTKRRKRLTCWHAPTWGTCLFPPAPSSRQDRGSGGSPFPPVGWDSASPPAHALPMPQVRHIRAGSDLQQCLYLCNTSPFQPFLLFRFPPCGSQCLPASLPVSLLSPSLKEARAGKKAKRPPADQAALLSPGRVMGCRISGPTPHAASLCQLPQHLQVPSQGLGPEQGQQQAWCHCSRE